MWLLEAVTAAGETTGLPESGWIFVRQRGAGRTGLSGAGGTGLPAGGVKTVQQLVEFGDEHGESLVILLFGDQIAEFLHALFGCAV